MTQRSRFWNGLLTGDAVDAPYDAPTEFAAVLRSMVQADQFTSRSLVFPRQLNELRPTTGIGVVDVDSGRALVSGTWYENNASVAIPMPAPAGATRIDRIVVRKDWTTQLARLTRIVGVEGGAAPALVQIADSVWDMPIVSYSVTTGGTITLVEDQRNWGFDLVPPTCILGATFNYAFIGSTTLLYDNVIFRTDFAMFDTTFSTEFITIVRPGLYIVGAAIQWDDVSPASVKQLWIRRYSGGVSTTIALDVGPGHDTAQTTNHAETVIPLLAGDQLRLIALHSSPGALAVLGSAAPKFWVRYLQQYAGAGF